MVFWQQKKLIYLLLKQFQKILLATQILHQAKYNHLINHFIQRTLEHQQFIQIINSSVNSVHKEDSSIFFVTAQLITNTIINTHQDILQMMFRYHKQLVILFASQYIKFTSSKQRFLTPTKIKILFLYLSNSTMFAQITQVISIKTKTLFTIQIFLQEQLV
ncbi:hypothetical protein TTHERM_000717709 (macronuclear) [Tetrahymena thermophila SB210]|uniref:Uncharacterized protein n=1 Tax=Tetrahymena thermophila (strain SB210) TaxID=312017 RepID=W7XH71_TETTS|nr:hypothetical protein TTHERM_000717709 [Tetrahymena thermophila SB210]EWS73676.1 hypothetical protein TTHERM_000717709 [Tetrahymena thermophila SB210]|eukprot:XP_012653806.1 hypothetical protein TTHERM_000717709 [Tetrahymena thermophila SB210]